MEKAKSILDKQFHTTNNHILDGSNNHITFKAKGEFFLTTPKVDKDIESGLSDIFPQNEYIPLLEALTAVEEKTGFLDSFTHYSAKYSKRKPADLIFHAAIITFGCNIGIGKMKKISKGINHSELDKVINWFFSLENIQNANDKILDYISKLELPGLFQHTPGQVHTSSDGQKFNVAVDSLNANYAFKYLGKDLGVSVSSFIDEREFLFFSEVNKPTDREAISMIDGLCIMKLLKAISIQQIPMVTLMLFSG